MQNEESAKVDPGQTDGQRRDLLLLMYYVSLFYLLDSNFLISASSWSSSGMSHVSLALSFPPNRVIRGKTKTSNKEVLKRLITQSSFENIAHSLTISVNPADQQRMRNIFYFDWHSDCVISNFVTLVFCDLLFRAFPPNHSNASSNLATRAPVRMPISTSITFATNRARRLATVAMGVFFSSQRGFFEDDKYA